MDIQETNLDYNDKNKKVFWNLKKELADLNKRYKRAVEDAESRVKISLLVKDNSTTNTLGKDKLIEMNNKSEEVVYQQFNKLEEAQRNILDIEGRGNSISRELNSQTEVMLRVNSNIDAMNDGLTASGSLIKKMWRRESRNKLVIASVAIFFIFIFITIIMMKFSSGSSTTVVYKNSSSRLTNENNLKSDLNLVSSEKQKNSSLNEMKSETKDTNENKPFLNKESNENMNTINNSNNSNSSFEVEKTDINVR